MTYGGKFTELLLTTVLIIAPHQQYHHQLAACSYLCHPGDADGDAPRGVDGGRLHDDGHQIERQPQHLLRRVDFVNDSIGKLGQIDAVALLCSSQLNWEILPCPSRAYLRNKSNQLLTRALYLVHASDGQDEAIDDRRLGVPDAGYDGQLVRV